MALSEEAIKKALVVKYQYDQHMLAIQSLVDELYTVFKKDMPEITQMDTIHWMENFKIEEPHEN
jgi:hypothetical protein